MNNDNQLSEKVLHLSSDILNLSRNTLLVNFRFLDRSLSHLEFIPDENFSFEVNGEQLYYGPWFILTVYRKEQTAVARCLLHSIFHCVYCHSFVGKDIDHKRWDLACDISVENTINSLHASCVHTSQELLQSSVISALNDELNLLSAEKIYRYLLDRELSDDEIDKMRLTFIEDNHSLWYGESENAKPDDKVKLKKLWQEVSKRMQTELETMMRDSDSALVQNLKSLNRAKHSYKDFLRRFGVHGEVMQLSDEEFDNNFYTYGLELYGNIPLIEPLEYSEQKRIREFVIAIDTSGSVKGNVVQSFIQHTHDLLMQQQSFFTKINVHVIQCDHVIREDAVLRTKEEFDEYIKTMTLKGFETTDFRPVFSYVDSLILSGQISNLQGLLYFTDGLGIFPQNKPAYDTAFIISRGDNNDPDLPLWAQHITLSEEDIIDQRFSS